MKTLLSLWDRARRAAAAAINIHQLRDRIKYLETELVKARRANHKLEMEGLKTSLEHADQLERLRRLL